MEAAFLSAAIPDPCRVLGVHLRPFCLGHLMLFRRFNLSLLECATVPPLDEFILGLSICSSTPTEFIEIFRSGELAGVVRKFIKRHKSFDLVEKWRIFKGYLQEAIEFPKWSIVGEGRELSAPWLASLQTQLVTDAGLSYSEAMTLPLSQCVWMLATIGERKDAIQFDDVEVSYSDMRKMADQYAKEARN